MMITQRKKKTLFLSQTGHDSTEDAKTSLMKGLFSLYKDANGGPDENTVTGLSERAEGFLTKAVELWSGGNIFFLFIYF